MTQPCAAALQTAVCMPRVLGFDNGSTDLMEIDLWCDEEMDMSWFVLGVGEETPGPIVELQDKEPTGCSVLGG